MSLITKVPPVIIFLPSVPFVSNTEINSPVVAFRRQTTLPNAELRTGRYNSFPYTAIPRNVFAENDGVGAQPEEG